MRLPHGGSSRLCRQDNVVGVTLIAAAAFGLIYALTALRGSRRRAVTGRVSASPLAGLDVH